VSVQQLKPPDDARALLFDWDGTLADSQLLNFRVLSQAPTTVDLAMSYDWFAARTGTSTAEMVVHVEGAHGRPTDPEQIPLTARIAATRFSEFGRDRFLH